MDRKTRTQVLVACLMHTSYLMNVLDSTMRETRIEQAVEDLREHEPFFDTIAVRGASGLILGSIIAHRLNKQLAFCRKVGENSHSSCLVEGPREPTFVIIDDMICSGTTIRVIARQVKEALRGKCYGIYTVESAPQTIDDLYDIRSFSGGASPSFEGLPHRRTPEEAAAEAGVSETETVRRRQAG
jgi:adenine/guanine phosphoribosyltransferase-like PRPP-binding protein